MHEIVPKNKYFIFCIMTDRLTDQVNCLLDVLLERESSPKNQQFILNIHRENHFFLITLQTEVLEQTK